MNRAQAGCLVLVASACLGILATFYFVSAYLVHAIALGFVAAFLLVAGIWYWIERYRGP